CHVIALSARLPSPEEAHGMGHVCRRISRCDSADDWLGCGERFARSWSLAAVRDFVLVAVPTFSRDRVDVSRRLRARGDPDAAGGGQRGNSHVSANRADRDCPGWSEPVAGGAWIGRRGVACCGGCLWL